MIVIFLGPDGAGKSTILEGVKGGLTQSRRGWISKYFAPGFLPRYRPRAGVGVTTNPHEGRQYPAIVVLAKVLLMLFEFTMGVSRLRKRTDIVLFDRFIHDLLVDPVRYRMGRVRWWMRALLKLAPRPDLLIVITAPAHVIHSRKQEVSFEETERQDAAYRALLEIFPVAILIENTGTPEEAIDIALRGILEQ